MVDYEENHKTEDFVNNEILRIKLNSFLNKLKPREKEVIELRYLGDRLRTLEEVGKIMGGVTRERIRQIESKAISKLKYYGLKELLS